MYTFSGQLPLTRYLPLRQGSMLAMNDRTEKLPQGLPKAICLWRRCKPDLGTRSAERQPPTKQETRLARVGIPSPFRGREDVNRAFSFPKNDSPVTHVLQGCQIRV